MHMKTRVTLTLEPWITHRAKSVARQRGTSLSSLVDQLLAKECGEPTKHTKTSFTDKWGGKLRFAEKKSPRFEYLRQKYSA